MSISLNYGGREKKQEIDEIRSEATSKLIQLIEGAYKIYFSPSLEKTIDLSNSKLSDTIEAK